MTTVSSNKSRHYARFIPNEEVSGAAQWQFGAVGKSPEVAAVPHVEEPAPTFDEQALYDAREAGYAEGFEQGKLASALEAQAQIEHYASHQGEATAHRMAALLQTLASQLEGNETALGEHVVALACEIARQVVRRELTVDRAAVVPVALEAVSLLVQDSLPTVLRVHPLDADLVGEALRQQMAGRAFTVLPDPSVQPGSCLAEQGATSVDASLNKRWRRAVDALGMPSAWAQKADDHAS